MRCLAIANALAKAGWKCGFACAPGSADVVPWLKNYPYLELIEDTDHMEQLEARWPGTWDVAVTDNYEIDASYEKRLRARSERLLVVDDIHNRFHDCDFLLDQTLGREEDVYRPWVNADCQLLLGASYALLRPEFSHLRSQSLERRGRLAGKVERIFISFGATDFPNLGGRALEALRMVGFNGHIDMVFASGAPYLSMIREQAKSLPCSVDIHVDCDFVADLLCQADLAMGAPGITSWERCTLGVPSILVPWADNQRDNAEVLAAKGIADVPGWEKDITAEDLARTLDRLLRDRTYVENMTRLASTGCDGRGIVRVLMKLLPGEQGRNGETISLRFAEFGDRKRLYDWQALPQTRKYFRNPEVPTWDEHVAWFETAIAAPNRYLCIVEVNGTPAGSLRLDWDEDKQLAEISVYTNPKMYKVGVAGGALRLARSLWPEWTFYADVAPENLASHALFSANGFVKSGERAYFHHGSKQGSRHE